MKTLRRISAATILSLTLAGSLLAGQIECPGAKPPESTPMASTIILMIVTVPYR
ncbi:MAG TPA: hypothetical protein VFI24_12895 [Pyrinomonadaceae bacterium]|nr:hypothetical protein [Pyrinomonadaceae bacterium]